jgi:hypothetical protein
VEELRKEFSDLLAEYYTDSNTVTEETLFNFFLPHLQPQSKESEWISVDKQEPKKDNEFDVYTNCICGILNKEVILDAVYYHEEKKFFHNQDTTHSNPFPATHFMYPLKPPIK